MSKDHAVMYSPCANCPFRSDKPAFLRKDKARQIVRAMHQQQNFHCHKTIAYDTEDGEGRTTADSKICAGFAIMCEKAKLPTQMMRIAERVGLYDRRKLDMKAKVHKSPKAFIDAQS